MSRRRAVITGIGPITCIGHGRVDFWNGILAEKSGINSFTTLVTGAFRVRCAVEIRDWDREEFFPAHRL
jgi:3-oxoacyl-[acyl-carrier-protein] synthase II